MKKFYNLDACSQSRDTGNIHELAELYLGFVTRNDNVRLIATCSAKVSSYNITIHIVKS